MKRQLKYQQNLKIMFNFDVELVISSLFAYV